MGKTVRMHQETPKYRKEKSSHEGSTQFLYGLYSEGKFIYLHEKQSGFKVFLKLKLKAGGSFSFGDTFRYSVQSHLHI